MIDSNVDAIGQYVALRKTLLVPNRKSQWKIIVSSRSEERERWNKLANDLEFPAGDAL